MKLIKRQRYFSVRLCLLLMFAQILSLARTQDRAKDNGDIYVVNEKKLMDSKMSTSVPVTTIAPVGSDASSEDEFAAAVTFCNASFSIPTDYIVQFNATAELPNVIDKTAMCFIRCFYERTGLIENWKLNAEKIRQSMWPATGDSIDYCQQQGKREVNACVRMYAIAKCLMIRAIVDARNKPVV